MIRRKVIDTAPNEQPQKTEHARQQKRRPPSPAKVHPEDDERSNCSPDRGSTIEQSSRGAPLALGKPFRHCLGRARPIRRLACPQEKPKRCTAVETAGQRSRNGND